MSDQSKNQRRFPRVPAETSVLVRLAKEPEVGAFSKTKVVGLGGCLFAHHQLIPPGTSVWVAIALRDRILEIPSRTVYANERPDGTFDIGVEFLLMSANDKIFLAELLQWVGGSAPR